MAANRTSRKEPRKPPLTPVERQIRRYEQLVKRARAEIDKLENEQRKKVEAICQRIAGYNERRRKLRS